MIDSMIHRKSHNTSACVAIKRSNTGWHKHISTRKIIGLSTLMLAMASATVWASEKSAPSTTPTNTCYVDGVSDRLNCGFVTVPENPNKPDGKQIQVHYVVLPAVKNVNHEEKRQS